MPNNYYEGTGVLVLDKVTPVITALFRSSKLDPHHPGNGQAYIASSSVKKSAQWSDIHESLLHLSCKLDLPCPDDNTERTLVQTLTLLAQHFHTESKLADLLTKHTINDDDEVEFATLFYLATCFDDGHGLQEIHFEGAWYCSKLRLFQFGGHGFFLSREFEVYGNSTEHISMGVELRKAILKQDINTAADLLFANLSTVITGISDEKIRQDVTTELSNRIHNILASR